MKHCFIVNPAAGGGKITKTLSEKIDAECKKLGVNYDIYFTKCVGDAEIYSKRVASENADSGDITRFYSCGGDGTLNEVANGILGYENAELAMIPAGTGNDFPRNFKNYIGFTDIASQIQGKSGKIDLIKHNDRVGVNMFNIGFDACCVKTLTALRGFPLMMNSIAYIIGVAINLITMPNAKLNLIFDDGEKLSGKYLLCAIANGKYCGGGFKAASKAEICDGIIDVLVVNVVSRLKFLSLVGNYKLGTLLDRDDISDIVRFKRCRSLEIVNNNGACISVDGEISEFSNVKFSILPKAMNFSVPKGCKFPADENLLEYRLKA